MSDTPPAPQDLQFVAEVLAVFDRGNVQLNSSHARALASAFRAALQRETAHHLYLRDANDPTSFFGCGTAEGATSAMVEDNRLCTLVKTDKETCPNCAEPATEEDDV